MGLAVLASVVTLVVFGCWYAVEFRSRAQARVFVTGAAESTAALLDGSKVSLSAHSMLTVDETGSQRVAFQEAGEIIYNVRATPARPFILQTIRATATVFANATLRVAIGPEIHFEVLSGVVKVALRDAKPDAPARWLRKGETLRVPVNRMSPVLADARLGMSVCAAG